MKILQRFGEYCCMLVLALGTTMLGCLAILGLLGLVRWIFYP